MSLLQVAHANVQNDPPSDSGGNVRQRQLRKAARQGVPHERLLADRADERLAVIVLSGKPFAEIVEEPFPLVVPMHRPCYSLLAFVVVPVP